MREIFLRREKCYSQKANLSYEELLESYTEQVTAVANAGVDLLVAETMLSVDETCVFMDAALSVCDLPIMCSLTLEADGSALFGGNAVEAVETLQEMGASAVGLNCSVGPDQLEAVVNSMKKVARVPVIVKPNAGLPKITPTGEAIYSMDAPTFCKIYEHSGRRGCRHCRRLLRNDTGVYSSGEGNAGCEKVNQRLQFAGNCEM